MAHCEIVAAFAAFLGLLAAWAVVPSTPARAQGPLIAGDRTGEPIATAA